LFSIFYDPDFSGLLIYFILMHLQQQLQ